MSAHISLIKPTLLTLTVFIFLALAQGSALAQTTGFTYQGHLTDGGAPATGQYDIEFRLFSVTSGGSVLANGTLLINSIQVTGGVFTIKLDYGPNSATLFDGTARFIEMAVRVSGSGNPLTTLAPRQEVTSTPYALRAATVSTIPGNLVTSSLNDASTNTVISESRLDPNLVRLAPASTQAATATVPFINITGTGDDRGSFARFSYNGKIGAAPINQTQFEMKNDGGFLATGTLGVGTIPANGCGYRMMWYPFKAAFRAGGAGDCPGTTQWDDANIGFYSWAGGNGSKASAFATFAFGDQTTVTGVDGAGFGGSNTVGGTAGFSTGASNKCNGFGCVAMGFTNRAMGQGSIALGYRSGAFGEYSVALGQRATDVTACNNAPSNDPNCDFDTLTNADGHPGSFIFSDQSTTNYVGSQVDNSFTARASGGFRFRTNSNQTTGCNLPAGSGVFSCSSSKTLKENFAVVTGEDLLSRVRKIPVNTWNYISEGRQVRHLGPFAEDFYGQFQLGVDNKSIGLLDIAGVNFAANQALERRTAQLQERTAVLQQKAAEVDQLRAQVNALRAENASMESRLKTLERAYNRPAQKRRAIMRAARER